MSYEIFHGTVYLVMSGEVLLGAHGDFQSANQCARVHAGKLLRYAEAVKKAKTPEDKEKLPALLPYPNVPADNIVTLVGWLVRYLRREGAARFEQWWRFDSEAEAQKHIDTARAAELAARAARYEQNRERMERELGGSQADFDALEAGGAEPSAAGVSDVSLPAASDASGDVLGDASKSSSSDGSAAESLAEVEGAGEGSSGTP